jgi:hypothetical protein
MEGAARGEVEGGKHLLELVVQIQVLTVAFIGLVSNVPMPMSSLPPDARCATSSTGENLITYGMTNMDRRPFKQADKS